MVGSILKGSPMEEDEASSSQVPGENVAYSDEVPTEVARNRPRRAIVIAAVGLGVVVAILATLAGLNAIFGEKTYVLSGVVAVYEGKQDDNGSCSTISPGYGDVGAGAAVVVSSPSGEELAYGELEDGWAYSGLELAERLPASAYEGGEDEKMTSVSFLRDNQSSLNNACVFEWTVSDIPQGEKYYVLETDRGEQRIEPDEMGNFLGLSVGDLAG